MTPEERSQIKWAAERLPISKLIEVMLESPQSKRGKVARLAFKLKIESYHAVISEVKP